MTVPSPLRDMVEDRDRAPRTFLDRFLACARCLEGERGEHRSVLLGIRRGYKHEQGARVVQRHRGSYLARWRVRRSDFCER